MRFRSPKGVVKVLKAEGKWFLLAIILALFLVGLILYGVETKTEPTRPSLLELRVNFKEAMPISLVERQFPQGDKTPPPVEPPVEQAFVQPVQPQVYATGCEQWRGLVAKYFPDPSVALMVMNGESGGNPSAISQTDDHGLFQINRGTWYGYCGDLPFGAIYDPETNIRIASYIYNSRSWSAWTVARNLGLN
jgi:hypothetical protein